MVSTEAFPNKPGGVCSSKPKAPARPAGNTGFLTSSVPKTLKLHQSKLGSGKGKPEMNCPAVAASYFMKMEIILLYIYIFYKNFLCLSDPPAFAPSSKDVFGLESPVLWGKKKVESNGWI